MKFTPGDYVHISESDVYANAQVVKVRDDQILIRLLREDEKEENLNYGGGGDSGKRTSKHNF